MSRFKVGDKIKPNGTRKQSNYYLLNNLYKLEVFEDTIGYFRVKVLDGVIVNNEMGYQQTLSKNTILTFFDSRVFSLLESPTEDIDNIDEFDND